MSLLEDLGQEFAVVLRLKLAPDIRYRYFINLSGNSETKMPIMVTYTWKLWEFLSEAFCLSGVTAG